MAPLIATTAAGETFNAGPAGAAVTPSNTSMTSAASGTGTAVFATGANEGAYCLRILTTDAQSKFLPFEHTPVALAWYVLDLYVEAFPSVGVLLASWLNGTTKVGDLRLGVDGTLVVRDNNAAVITATAAVTAGAWHRIAVKAAPGSSTGHGLRVYRSPNSLTGTAPDVDLTGAATAAGQTAVSTLRLGVLAAAALAYRVDRLRSDDTAEPGGSSGGGGTPDPTPADDLVDEDFEGVTTVPADGAAVTTGNTTLDNVSGTGTATFTATAVDGTRSALITCSAQDKTFRKDFTAKPDGWFVWKLRITALPAATTYLASWFSGAVKVGDLRLTSTGTLQLRDNNTLRATSTVSLVAGSDHRIAVHVAPGSATGHRLKIYLSEDSTSASYDSGGVTANDAAQTALDNFRWGVIGAGTLTYRLDRLRGSSTGEPGISGGGNVAPVANAGADQRVLGDSVVTLPGAGTDVDGTISSYTWRQVSGTAVALSSTTAQSPTFTAPLVSTDSTLVFGLTVTDNSGAASPEDQVTVTVGAAVTYVARSGAWAPKGERAAKGGVWV